MLVLLIAGETIMTRFENEDSSTLDDIKTAMETDYETAVYNDFENESGTLTFRVMLLMERIDYLLNNPRYTVFGIGTRHEDSPKTKRQFDFNLGTINHKTLEIGQISSADLAWVTPLMRFGFLGIALFLYLSWTIIQFLYKRRKDSDMAMSAFLFYLLLIIISLKNNHLFGNLQMFFIYLLIEYMRYSRRHKGLIE